jgi:Tfp pilus assembly protein PilX
VLKKKYINGYHQSNCMHMYAQKQIKQRGFTLFIAAMVSSVLLSLAIYMAGIAQKELLLTNLARESQYAFYAADAGAECMLYMDFLGYFDPANGAQSARGCNDTLLANLGAGQTVGGTGGATPTGNFTPVFTTSTTVPSLRFSYQQANRCIITHIYKIDANSDGILDNNGTRIDSLGYNTTCAQTNSPRRLERAVRLQY